MNECCRETFLDATGFTTWLLHCGLSLVLLTFMQKVLFSKIEGWCSEHNYAKAISSHGFGQSVFMDFCEKFKFKFL